MSQDTEESQPGKECVAYQSISLSDEDEEDQRDVVGEESKASSGGTEGHHQSIASTFTNLKKIDEICGQVSQANVAEDGGNNHEEGIITDPDNELKIVENVAGHACFAQDEKEEDNRVEGMESEKDIFSQDTPLNTQENADDMGEMDEEIEEEEDYVENADDDGGNITSDEGDIEDDSDNNTITVDVPTYTCKLCKTIFRVQHQVESHLMVEHDLGEQTALFTILPPEKKKRVWRKGKDCYFHCLFCDHRSRRSINVREHEKQKHQNEKLPLKEYSCKLCNQQFALQEIFGHIQNEHPSEADTMNFVGNSLTEHYSMNFTTESTIIAKGQSENEREAIELSEDGFYHCGKCDFCSQELDAFTEHYKEHSLANVLSSCDTYNYCQQCPYKNKSLRGLRQHEKMQHLTASVKKSHTICLACGEKRLINHIHKCSKAAKRGRKPSLLRNPEGELMCSECSFTAKDYNIMYTHTKANNHQAQRDPSSGRRTPTPKVLEFEESSDGSRLLRGKKAEADGTKDSANGDGGDEEGDENGDQDRALAEAMQEMGESDYSQQSEIDDSDDDPEWAPSLKGTPPRKPPRQSKAMLSDSDWDSDSPSSSRKRRPSGEENGRGSKRRKLADIPKDPESPAPKKLENGMFGCNFCEFESKYGHSIEAHQWRHTGFRPYKCETCKKGFRQRLSMEKHKCSTSLPGEGDKGVSISETSAVPVAILLTAGDAAPANQSDTVLISDKQPVTPSVDTPTQTSTGGTPQDDYAPTETAALGNEKSQKGPFESKVAENLTPEVISPAPIVIAPPLPMELNTLSHLNMGHTALNDGRDISQAIDLDDDNDVVCNLDGNEDMPPPTQTPPQGLHMPMGVVGQVGMTSPVGTPLNITPIPGMEHHNTNLNGMGHYSSPDGARFGIGQTQPTMMDLQLPDHMMNPMPGMMGDGHLMHHGASQMGMGLQHPDQSVMHHHHMNPMGGHGILDSGPQFQNPDGAILDHLNLMPNNMLPQGSGFAVPQPPPPLPTLDSNMISMNNSQFGSMQMPLYNNSIPPTFGNMGNTDPIDVDAEPISAFTPPVTTSHSEFESMTQSTPPVSNVMDMNHLDTNTATQSPNRFDMNPSAPNTGMHESMPVTTTVAENLSHNLNVVPATESNPAGQVLSGIVSCPIPAPSSAVGSITSLVSTTSTPPMPSSPCTPIPSGAADANVPPESPALAEVADQPSVSVENGPSSSTPTPTPTPTSDMVCPTVQTPPQLVTSAFNTETLTTSSPPSHGNTVSDTEGMPSGAPADVNIGEGDPESGADMQSAPGADNMAAETATGTDTAVRTEGAADSENTVATTDGLFTDGAMAEGPVNTLESGDGGPVSEALLGTSESEAGKLPETSPVPPPVVSESASEAPDTEPAVPASTIPGGVALSGTDEAPPPLTITSVNSMITGVPVARGATNESGKTINDLFKCILCRVYFEDQQMYRNHMVHHGGAIGTCRICGRMFRTPLLFMSHLHCSVQCKGVNANVAAPVTQMPVRTRGRGRGTATTVQTVGRQMYNTGQIPVPRARMRAPSPMQTNSMMAPSRMSNITMRGTSPLQAMRQMAPTSGRRGRPPIGRGGGAYGAALMRQPLQQQHFSAQLQQMGAMRGRPSGSRAMSMAHRQQRPLAQQEDIVIVID